MPPHVSPGHGQLRSPWEEVTVDIEGGPLLVGLMTIAEFVLRRGRRASSRGRGLNLPHIHSPLACFLAGREPVCDARTKFARTVPSQLEGRRSLGFGVSQPNRSQRKHQSVSGGVRSRSPASRSGNRTPREAFLDFRVLTKNEALNV